MNSQVKGMLLSLGMMQVARKVPTDRPDILLLIRCTYVLSQLIQFGLFFYASLQIKKKNDLTVLKYSEPPKPFSQSTEPPAQTVTTVKDYDLAQVTKNTPQQLIGLAIMAVMHLKFGYTQPLLIQSILPLKNIFDNPIIQLHVLGKPAVGDLKRPFKAAPGLMSALQDASAGEGNATATEPVAAGGAKIEEIKEETKKDL